MLLIYLLYIYIYLVVLHGRQDVSSPTRDRTRAPCNGRRVLTTGLFYTYQCVYFNPKLLIYPSPEVGSWTGIRASWALGRAFCRHCGHRSSSHQRAGGPISLLLLPSSPRDVPEPRETVPGLYQGPAHTAPPSLPALGPAGVLSARSRQPGCSGRG